MQALLGTESDEKTIFQAFLTAIEAKHASTVRLFLDRWEARGSLLEHVGESMFLAMNPGTTPLHIACQAGNAEIVALLLDAGASLNATTSKFESGIRDEGGWKPIDVAISCGHPTIKELLESHGAQPSPQCADREWIKNTWKNPFAEIKASEARLTEQKEHEREEFYTRARYALPALGFLAVGLVGAVRLARRDRVTAVNQTTSTAVNGAMLAVGCCGVTGMVGKYIWDFLKKLENLE
ncbi:hypothetical protein CYMTET_26567 [Cymbomonas tetramitiformis]|uniref:Uncharacterized protein n=1 Tax=Cymbomonas tetramitiformis TaxID=36881 RepID=A0AAE0FRH1_9CHLO|nr:hypothetical protein CYMTET_26567 [Cymbomonas tetramitiformis]